MDIKTKLRHYYGAYKLTLSGEITLSSPKASRLYELTGEPRQQVREILNQFHGEYPFMEVELKDSISEGRICFFSCGSAVDDEQFLEHFQNWLGRLAHAAGKEDQVVVTINCSGQFSQGGHMQKFRFLNKGTEIQYKITDTYELPTYVGWARSRYVRFAQTAVLAGFLLWMLYDVLTKTKGILM